MRKLALLPLDYKTLLELVIFTHNKWTKKPHVAAGRQIPDRSSQVCMFEH